MLIFASGIKNLIWLHRCVLSTIYSVLSRALWKKPTGNHSGGIRTHDLCIATADVLPLDRRASPVARGGFEFVAAGTATI